MAAGKKTSRIGAWSRLGIVASIAWIVAWPIYWNGRVEERAIDEQKLSNRICGLYTERAAEECVAEGRHVYEVHKLEAVKTVPEWLLGSAISLAAAWLAAYVIGRVARWIFAGRGPKAV